MSNLLTFKDSLSDYLALFFLFSLFFSEKKVTLNLDSEEDHISCGCA
jgi:hypothetical protein